MSTAGNHHYVPQFHLRHWTGPDQKIVRWTRAPHTGALGKRHITIASTAYVAGLYSLEHVDPAEVQRIETEVFGQIESRASPVLKKLVEVGPGTLTVEERYWWTRYLQASLLRVPHVVQHMKAEGIRQAREYLSKDDKDFKALKGSAPESSLLEWAEKHAPDSIANAGLRVLVRMLMDEWVIDRIIHLRWIVRDLSQSNRPLLIGDDPFERIGNLYKPRTLISIPLTPSHVFFGTDAKDVVNRITAWMTDKLRMLPMFRPLVLRSGTFMVRRRVASLSGTYRSRRDSSRRKSVIKTDDAGDCRASCRSSSQALELQ